MDGLMSGKYSIGCPLPDGFKAMTEKDRERLREVMAHIIEIEKAAK